jgi:hypothetical protein
MPKTRFRKVVHQRGDVIRRITRPPSFTDLLPLAESYPTLSLRPAANHFHHRVLP